MKSKTKKENCTLPADYQLNLSDFALFLSVMKIKEAYADILSIIMDEPDLVLSEVMDQRIVELDRIVGEVKQSE